MSKQDVKQKILRTVYERYTQSSSADGADDDQDTRPGLMELADDLGITMVPPSDKIVVLMIGNHSAGKSSFINWYIDEKVQRESKATETSVFTFVTHGKKRQTLEGTATLANYKHFAEIKEIAGIAQCLQTEVVTSRSKKFPYIMFIDTPGLQDNANYPYDVESGIEFLGEKADLVFVFFDPHGCANVKKTLDVTESIQKKAGADIEKIKYALTKADLAGSVNERSKIIQQTVQKLCQRPCLNKPTLDIKTIFLETRTENDVETNKLENQLEDLVRDMHDTISKKIQRTLTVLESDVRKICEAIDKKLKVDKDGQNTKMMNIAKAFGFICLTTLIALMCFLVFVVSLKREEGKGEANSAVNQIASAVPETLMSCAGFLESAFELFPDRVRQGILVFVVAIQVYLVFTIYRLFSSDGKALSWKKKQNYKEVKEWLETEVIAEKEEFYQQFFKDLGINDNQ